jgi:hypothetical protein
MNSIPSSISLSLLSLTKMLGHKIKAFSRSNREMSLNPLPSCFSTLLYIVVYNYQRLINIKWSVIFFFYDFSNDTLEIFSVISEEFSQAFSLSLTRCNLLKFTNYSKCQIKVIVDDRNFSIWWYELLHGKFCSKKFHPKKKYYDRLSISSSEKKINWCSFRPVVKEKYLELSCHQRNMQKQKARYNFQVAKYW